MENRTKLMTCQSCGIKWYTQNLTDLSRECNCCRDRIGRSEAAEVFKRIPYSSPFNVGTAKAENFEKEVETPNDTTTTGTFTRLHRPTTSTPDSPDHYSRYAIQPIDFIGNNKLDFLVGNVVKYVCRFDAKGGLEDLEKARAYLEALEKRYVNGNA